MTVTYRVRSDAGAIEARAEAIAVEQSVEMPLAAISNETVLRDIAGKVLDIAEAATGLFEVRIGLSLESMGTDPGQLLNMLFGNTSLQEDVTLADADFPHSVLNGYGGPHAGIAELRNLSGSWDRAVTCTALKPQGLCPADLSVLAASLAQGGVDFIKDDHGLADQIYSPFEKRVEACAAAVRATNAVTGFRTQYVPNVSGSLDTMRSQTALAAEQGLGAVLLAPMIAGLSNFHRLAKDFPNMAFFAHPAMAGASRIAPQLLLGKLFRLFGAGVVIYPNYGGRFSYPAEACRDIARSVRQPWGELAPAFPAPAGGMTLERVPELLEFYGPDTILLIGGSLLAERDRLTEATAAFVSRVRNYRQEQDHL